MLAIEPIRNIFRRFQNLNLIFLIEDLHRNLAARGKWASSESLCPVAHGMPDGAAVEKLKYLSQAVNLDAACKHAACELGTHEVTVRQFVDMWDCNSTTMWLLQELEQIWAERLEDALFMTGFFKVDDRVVVHDAGENQLVGSQPL